MVELRKDRGMNSHRTEERDVGPWLDLLRFTPHDAEKRLLVRRGARVLALEDARGLINLDEHAVWVYELPRGIPTPVELLHQIRLHINDLINPRFARFEPLSVADARLWRSRFPIGALLHMDPTEEVPLICSDASDHHWRTSTISTGPGQSHLLSGHRDWGFDDKGNGGWVFYTRGAERVTERSSVPWQRLIFQGVRHLWTSFQVGLEHFINNRGGQALAEKPISCHRTWGEVMR